MSKNSKIFKFSLLNLTYYYSIPLIALVLSLIFYLFGKATINELIVSIILSAILFILLIIFFSVTGVKSIAISKKSITIEKRIGKVKTFNDADILLVVEITLRYINSIYIIYLKNNQHYRFTDFGIDDKMSFDLSTELKKYNKTDKIPGSFLKRLFDLLMPF